MASYVQQPRLSTEQEGSSQHRADEQALKNGDSVPAQVDSGTLSEAPETAETVSMARVEQKNAIPSPNQTGSDVDSRPHINTLIMGKYFLQSELPIDFAVATYNFIIIIIVIQVH